jgi:hypothetical protein
MQHDAKCQCGRLTTRISGDPQFVGACHCRECQKRTGSAFGAGAYFHKEQVRLEGTATTYTRQGHSGRDLRYSFCPTCGTTLYWEIDAWPESCSVVLGSVALGSLDDPTRHTPTYSRREQSSLNWVELPGIAEHLPTQ